MMTNINFRPLLHWLLIRISGKVILLKTQFGRRSHWGKLAGLLIASIQHMVIIPKCPWSYHLWWKSSYANFTNTFKLIQKKSKFGEGKHLVPFLSCSTLFIPGACSALNKNSFDWELSRFILASPYSDISNSNSIAIMTKYFYHGLGVYMLWILLWM